MSKFSLSSFLQFIRDEQGKVCFQVPETFPDDHEMGDLDGIPLDWPEANVDDLDPNLLQDANSTDLGLLVTVAGLNYLIPLQGVLEDRQRAGEVNQIRLDALQRQPTDPALSEQTLIACSTHLDHVLVSMDGHTFYDENDTWKGHAGLLIGQGGRVLICHKDDFDEGDTVLHELEQLRLGGRAPDAFDLTVRDLISTPEAWTAWLDGLT